MVQAFNYFISFGNKEQIEKNHDAWQPLRIKYISNL